MQLIEVLNGTDIDMIDQSDFGITEISGLTCDSRMVKPGFIFAALPGSQLDGRDYIPNALKQGASCVLAPLKSRLPKHAIDVQTGRPVLLLKHSNPRRQYALMASRFYGAQPDLICAVTGTNGKTSVVTLLRQIWESLGYKAASLGTLGVVAGGFESGGKMTTPDSVDLHRDLRDLSYSGIDHLAIEASSHGLHQHRLDGVRVKVAAFTNLTQDHLDYHGSVDEYLAAKLRLFSEVIVPGGIAVINKDSEYAGAVEAVCRKKELQIISYGKRGDDVRLKASEIIPEGYILDISVAESHFKVKLPLIGKFQISNALAAAAVAIACGECPEQVIPKFEELKAVPGRMELAGQVAKGAKIFIDYAHTPDALLNVLQGLRPHTLKRLHLVFGCGGMRDSSKRAKMGTLANKLADVVIVTDDNPRTEDPVKIRSQILSQVPSAIEVPNREEAIHRAAQGLDKGDILIIAGKGHEKDQIIGTVARPFSDIMVARDIIKRMSS